MVTGKLEIISGHPRKLPYSGDPAGEYYLAVSLGESGRRPLTGSVELATHLVKGISVFIFTSKP